MNLEKISPLLLAAGLLSLMTPALTHAAVPVDVGSRLELFVDKHLVAEEKNVQFKLREPVCAPLAKSPLPERYMMTVIKDGELYRAYWRDSNPDYRGKVFTGHPGQMTRYGESKDGVEWTFPNLGLVEVAGSRSNNVILANLPPFLENFAPFLDTRPGVEAAAKYKALAGYPGAGDKRGLTEKGRGLFAFVSADGIRWTKKAEAIPYQPAWRHAFDSQNVSFWSEAEQCYVCYFRTWTESERLRSISRSTSKDFATWTPPVKVEPNMPGEHLYVSQTHPYFRAPHIYVALATRFVPGRGDAPAYDAKDENATDIVFMSARAGAEKFDRHFPEAFIRPGLDPARWKNRANYVAENVVPTSPTEMSIYHRSGARYVLRTDGFVSVSAGFSPGELVTKPIRFAGANLVVNFSTSARGSVQVEIQDAAGKPLPGFTVDECVPAFGDEIERAIKWKGKTPLSSLAGKPVRLRFVLQECDLYSYRFRE